ncbi:MAG: hypothetical protein JSR70_04945 [Proteobacteria bacterium]|nr:hypothetical protein [Pseudomonadota bacterium]
MAAIACLTWVKSGALPRCWNVGMEIPSPDVERILGWRCIGCGKVDAPRPCIGVCQDCKCELVLAGDYDALLALARKQAAVLSLIANVTPREGDIAATWSALQQRARQVLQESPR